MTPVAILGTQPLIIAAHPSFPGSTFADIVRMARAAPDTLAYSTSGIGGGGHLTAAWASSRAGIRLVHVPYLPSRALADVLSGEVPLAFSYPGTVLPLIRNGQLKGIAVTSLARLPAAPAIPTLAESGLAGFEVTDWQGLLAPAGTPAGVVHRLHQAVQTVLAAPALQERLQSLGYGRSELTPEQFAAMIRHDVARWKRVVADAGLHFD